MVMTKLILSLWNVDGYQLWCDINLLHRSFDDMYELNLILQWEVECAGDNHWLRRSFCYGQLSGPNYFFAAASFQVPTDFFLLRLGFRFQTLFQPIQDEIEVCIGDCGQLHTNPNKAFSWEFGGGTNPVTGESEGWYKRWYTHVLGGKWLLS